MYVDGFIEEGLVSTNDEPSPSGNPSGPPVGNDPGYVDLTSIGQGGFKAVGIRESNICI